LINETNLNTRRQLAINWRYCYSARRSTQNMSASRTLPTIALSVYSERNGTFRRCCFGDGRFGDHPFGDGL